MDFVSDELLNFCPIKDMSDCVFSRSLSADWPPPTCSASCSSCLLSPLQVSSHTAAVWNLHPQDVMTLHNKWVNNVRNKPQDDLKKKKSQLMMSYEKFWLVNKRSSIPSLLWHHLSLSSAGAQEPLTGDTTIDISSFNVTFYGQQYSTVYVSWMKPGASFFVPI